MHAKTKKRNNGKKTKANKNLAIANRSRVSCINTNNA